MAKLRDFFNKIANNNSIYTAEDIGEMSGNEFTQNEKAIDYQMENLGIPRRNDLSGNSDVIFVHSYTRADGTKVKAHYRSKHGGSITGAAADITEQPTMLEGGVTYNDYKQNQRSTIDDSSFLIDNITFGIKNKLLLDAGNNFIGLTMQQQDAAALWNIASEPFWNKNNEYINKNGALYNNIDSLGNEYTPYKTKIKEKVKSQFGKEDVPGIVFHENSTVAIAISNSQELGNFINKNKTTLKSGKEISGSIRFNGFTNLHNAFGSVDILSAKLNNGYVDITILDTYDFNPNDRNLIVQMGYSAQKVNLLNPYFTIVKCKYKLEDK